MPPEKVAALFDFETSPLFSDAERAALRVALGAGVVPNAVTDDEMSDLRRHFTIPQCVELIAAIAVFGFLNRWNDTVATELEGSPSTFGARVLASRGWNVGKHAATSSPAGADGGG